MEEKNKVKKAKNILYTGFGDKGTTTLYDCKQTRISKSALLVEALGAVDELNAYLGVIKTYPKSFEVKIKVGSKILSVCNIIEEIQQNLFIIQAELGGSNLFVKKSELTKTEKFIEAIAQDLPPIKSFTVSGGSVESASLDFARTLARKAERRIIAVVEEGAREVNANTISYLNRLSSALFALSRYTNFSLSIKENHPHYYKR